MSFTPGIISSASLMLAGGCIRVLFNQPGKQINLFGDAQPGVPEGPHLLDHVRDLAARPELLLGGAVDVLDEAPDRLVRPRHA